MLAHIHPSYSLVAFLLGIIIGDIFTLITRQVFVTSPVWLIVAILALIVTFFRPIPPLLLLSFLAGCICINYRASFDLAGQSYFSSLTGETITVTGTISEDPNTTDQQTALRLNNLIVSDTPTPGTLYIQMSPNRELQRSDIITVKGKLSEGFGTFSAMIYRPTIKNITRPTPGDVFLTVRNWFAGHIKSHLSDEESALGLGYLLGMRSSLPPGLSEKLKIVGLTHIIVASGANLSILIGFSRKWLGRISRFTAFFLSIFLVLGYVGIVGLAPSMTRAGLVSILSLIVWYVGREFKPWRLLLIVGAATLLISPT
ncbi:ComEC/Rec2 family competence protein, partial [Candidatus Saccharibacteria bacterium]|nr:ComEC/Rec2 family competence protein [Candidatus Saccharibacteria bacterium]